MIRLAALSFILLFAVVCCNERRAFEVASADIPLSNTYGSAEDLARAAIRAIEDSSEAGLQALQVSEQEYRNVIWLNLDAKEIGGLGVDKAWGWVQRDGVKAVNRALYDWGGRKWELVETRVLHEVRPRNRMNIIRGLAIVVEDKNGERETWDLLNVVVEMNGRYKVVAFDS